MQQADFIHLVRVSEQAAESDAKRYRQSVWWFSLLGWSVIAACALAALLLLAVVFIAWRHQGFRAWHAFGAVGAGGLLWVCVSALLTRVELPSGVRIEAQEAPELFEAIERIRGAVKGPRIDKVLVDDEFNAAIVQRPRFGVFNAFGQTNVLILGWPMLCALEPRRLYAVIAHEYGHLRGDHGKFSAWVYRTRAAWWRVAHSYQQADGPVAWLLRRFFDWYLPRFNARTFALARQDEYEADRIAARLCTPSVVAEAWTEIEIKTRWVNEVYWRDLWRRAAVQEVPDPMPFAAMRRKVRRGPEAAFAQDALRRALKRLPSHDDTHPVPRDRLAALGVRPEVPAWSRHSSVRLLGMSAKRVGAHFDQAWWERSRREWQRHREHLQQCLERINALRARARQLSADEFVDWADCFEALSGDDPSMLYEHALRLDPRHPRALRRMGEIRAQAMHADALFVLERLQQEHAQHGHAACLLALDLLDRRQHAGEDVPAAELKAWRERRDRFEQAEAKAWAAFSEAHPCEGTCTPQWSSAERRMLTDTLIRATDVKAAWVVGKSLQEMPQRDYLVVFVELQRDDEELARAVCARLMHELDSLAPRLLVTAVNVFVPLDDVEGCGAQAVYRRQGR
jgi:hypothetical protein